MDKHVKLSDQAFIQYSRQIMLKGWGEQGQLTLLNKHVAIVGCGGLGNVTATYLAGAGIGTLTLIDDDEVELSNLPRQFMFDHDSIENAKAFEVANRLQEQHPSLQLNQHAQRLTRDNTTSLLGNVDLILDCSDNMPTRYLINSFCVEQSVPLISASVANWHGQLLLVSPDSPEYGCYQCLFPQAPKEANSCKTLGVSGPMVGVLGSFQANAALRFLLNLPSDLNRQIHLVDGETFSMQPLNRQRNEQCPVCRQPN
ncbi:HesA/MoeB/ThiF family protein [Psychrobium sp. 1_MG-2023]|uniref:HesA/MoeB/ThiF family protein n=1 Tax=Psychrobium sp. 1_MG-2023 TaxID=3062624 RepID=UPI000C32735D|nr:HesA/MoeB/ThiF family protein [Psychrobium sp. 1_MG-2023]MDP2560168.1 HesA/MoeB/ThiF family protein [Psychrobium sp. 1_MG-2023]PKF56979.1 molybdopterin-synthase adenylyltransferase MoeB [Alteromonadales bacterium alter-6D02]